MHVSLVQYLRVPSMCATIAIMNLLFVHFQPITYSRNKLFFNSQSWSFNPDHRFLIIPLWQKLILIEKIIWREFFVFPTLLNQTLGFNYVNINWHFFICQYLDIIYSKWQINITIVKFVIIELWHKNYIDLIYI